MYDDIDNERDFWHDEPTRRLSRTPARDRTRQHLPVITTTEQPARRPLDPFVARLAAMLCIGVAMVPVALTLRHGASDVLRTAPTGGAAAVPVVAGQLSSTTDASPVDALVVAAAPAAVELAPATTEFDIDALPPATPVNDVGAAAHGAGHHGGAGHAKVAVATAPATVAATTPATTAAVEAPKPEAPTTAPACSSTYRVVSGDAWILIANKVGVTTKQLLAANGATGSTPLYPGRDICLPKGASTATTVKPPSPPPPPGPRPPR